MWDHHRVWQQLRISVIARPRMVPRVSHHGGTDRVQLDIAITAKQVALGIDQTRLAAAFPQRAGSSIPPVDVTHVLPTEATASSATPHQPMRVSPAHARDWSSTHTRAPHSRNGWRIPATRRGNDDSRPPRRNTAVDRSLAARHVRHVRKIWPGLAGHPASPWQTPRQPGNPSPPRLSGFPRPHVSPAKPSW